MLISSKIAYFASQIETVTVFLDMNFGDVPERSNNSWIAAFIRNLDNKDKKYTVASVFIEEQAPHNVKEIFAKINNQINLDFSSLPQKDF